MRSKKKKKQVERDHYKGFRSMDEAMRFKSGEARTFEFDLDTVDCDDVKRKITAVQAKMIGGVARVIVSLAEPD